MNNTIINRTLLILTLICLGFSQDEYPYFSDPNKQLQFEQKKFIATLHSDENTNEIDISNNSEFESTHIIKGANYKYRFKTKIDQNNRILTEIELLRILGLNEQADSLLVEYKILLDEYHKNPKKINSNLKIKSFLKSSGGTLKFASKVIGSVALLSSISTDDSNAKTALIVWLGIYYLGDWIEKKSIEIPEYVIINPPYCNQHYKNEVLKNLVESYNIRIYKEILDHE